MARFEVEIGGENLGRAQASLNEAGIPTIATGAGGGTRRVARRPFRGGIGLILLVIVLAFVAQRLVNPVEDDDTRTYDQLVAQIENRPGTIERVTLEPDRTRIELLKRNGAEHRSGYPPSEEQALLETLRRQGVEMVVEDRSGGGILSLIAYLLPFLLILGFWLFLMARTRRGGAQGASLPGAHAGPTGLKAVVEAESAAEAETRVHEQLPTDAAYRVART